MVKSYLSDRKQIVKFYEYRSSMKTISCGVPQGSVLGPLLFLLYVNDIHRSSTLLSFILFADDSLRVAVPSPRGKTGGRERLRKPDTNRVM